MGSHQAVSIELARATLRVLVRSPRAKVLPPPRPWASRNLPRPSASSPLDNRAPPMANASQVPDLEAPRCCQTLNPQQRHPSLMSSDLATLIPQKIVLTTSVPNEQGLGAEHQARPYVKGVPLQNLAILEPGQTDPPFTKMVLGARISSKFKLTTQLGSYEGKTDSMDHLDSYKSLMSLQGCSDEVMCKVFSATLKGPARNRQKNASHLFTVHQKEIESLKDFVKRFNQAILEVEDPSDKVIIMAMMEGLRPGPLFDFLSKNVPETLSALQSKADKYVAAEELAEAKRRRRGKDDHKRKELDTRRNDYREKTRYKKT
ncbi:hypothetical protein Acr_17g0001490 [Actinidia rufa]|uniref:Retrotransposon gag domain-containing protein n=1 Tax=Actinidia rufa TaxID=165716 RepID=A0A7J0G1C4_9ERIC|nr:hypothetical protein Acr_17g0001490 [Actinidia rufa]